MTELIPYTLKNEPALIEKVFPVQKVSFEAQQERTAVQSQTLTGLGSYWKGRKPLILVRSILLGSLLPQTDDSENDLELFEALMAFDLPGLGRRAVGQTSLKLAKIAKMIELSNPWDYFNFTVHNGNQLTDANMLSWHFPLEEEVDEKGFRLSWKRGISNEVKAEIYARALAKLPTYEERSLLCKRPEEVDPEFLYAPVWRRVNKSLGYLGINAHSIQELVEQLGILRYGHRPKVGDSFAGGGSIPFEAARMGCDVLASDLNPIASMLNWGNINIIGTSTEKRTEIELGQQAVAAAVEKEIFELGIEHDRDGNHAKAYLCCLETRCPDTGWLVPLVPSRIISKSRNVIAKLIPDYKGKRFDIEVVVGVSEEEMKAAEVGTVRDGKMVYSLEGKNYSTPLKTLRGDYRNENGKTSNRLRLWEKSDFMPVSNDIFQERVYCIQWINKDTINNSRKITYFASVTPEDAMRERKIETIVGENLADWQMQGLVPDMEIESGDETTRLKRERGWTYWHHLFSPRQLLVACIVRKHINNQSIHVQPALFLSLAKMIDWSSKLCRYGTGAARESITQTFYNQAYNTNYSYGVRSFVTGKNYLFLTASSSVVYGNSSIKNLSATEGKENCDYWITDPPYADAVNYHEISEFFIAWLRKNPPKPFDEWIWDSRRVIAIKGDGEDFRRGMINAYRSMTEHMADNGMQCVMFTHQDAGVWADMVGIFWSAGLQVVAAWYIATETTSELKKGGYVQGTVTLMLRKRPSGENVGFKQRILPAVRKEVQSLIEQMMHLNNEIKDKMGEPVFNDSDLQMAGYAAAIKVLTGYTSIGGEDVTAFALRPRRTGEITVVDEIIQQASEAANSILVPEGLCPDTWRAIDGIQRFYLRMMDMETTGASKLDNYQNFAKAFRVTDYTKVMGSINVNTACLKGVTEFTSRDLMESTEIGPTLLGRLIIALQQLIAETEPQIVILQLQESLEDYMELRLVLIDLVKFLSQKSNQISVREAAEVLVGRLRNQRILGQD